jgi:pyridoxine 5-phosphate synthase
MVAIGCRLRPADACLVPERRQELTTEGGLNVVANEPAVARAVQRLRDVGIRVSLFIDPVAEQIAAAARVGTDAVEIHTGRYADARDDTARDTALTAVREAVERAAAAGLIVNAGHGLTRDNVAAIAALPAIHELNIGHSLVARAIFVGLEAATREMKTRMVEARR